MLVIFNDIFYLSYLYLNIVILWFVLFHLTSWLAFRLIQLLCTYISQRHRPYSVKSGLLNLSSPSPVGVWYQTDLFHGLSTKCTMFCNWQNVLPGDTSWLNRSSRPRSTIGSEELLLPRVISQLDMALVSGVCTARHMWWTGWFVLLWRRGVESLSTVLALCESNPEGNPPMTGGFPTWQVWRKLDFFCWQPEQTVWQTVEFWVIWYTFTHGNIMCQVGSYPNMLCYRNNDWLWRVC